MKQTRLNKTKMTQTLTYVTGDAHFIARQLFFVYILPMTMKRVLSIKNELPRSSTIDPNDALPKGHGNDISCHL